MSDITFESSLTMEEIEKNFVGADLFSGIMDSLQSALEYRSGKTSENAKVFSDNGSEEESIRYENI